MAPPKPVKKLTRKELREIEEQKKKEEEEKRRLEEEEKERIRKEQERLRKLEEEKLAAEEKQRLQDENLQLEIWRTTVKQARETEQQKIGFIEDWNKFKLCDVKPDPTNESQINTFVTQYKEQTKIIPKKVEQLQIEQNLQNLQYSETIISQITQQYMKCLGENNFEDQKRYQNYIENIRSITLNKIEEITAALCLFSEDK